MNYKIILLALSLSLSSSSAISAHTLPSRKECIVKIIIHWPAKINDETKESTIEKLARAISMAHASDKSLVTTQGGIQGDKRQYYYLQLDQGCEKRLFNAKRLMEYAINKAHISLIYNISTDIITPSPKTIDAWGPWWSDHPDIHIGSH